MRRADKMLRVYNVNQTKFYFNLERVTYATDFSRPRATCDVFFQTFFDRYSNERFYLGKN